MSSIPYRLSEDLSRRIFDYPFQVYRALMEVLISGDGLGLFVQFYPPKSFPPQATFFLLKHIALRTFPFSKAFEFIRIGDIVKGIPTIGVAASPFKESTVKKTLSQLAKLQVIIKLELPRSRAVTSLYGLNIPAVLTILDLYWKNFIPNLDLDLENEEDGLARSLWSRRTQNILRCLVKFFEQYENLFSFLLTQNSPIKDFAAFTLSLKERLPKGHRPPKNSWQIGVELKDVSRVRVRDLIPQKYKEMDLIK